jgi:hypothetical protein
MSKFQQFSRIMSNDICEYLKIINLPTNQPNNQNGIRLLIDELTQLYNTSECHCRLL